MSVLVDTSVWIRFLAGKEPLASKLDALLADDDVLGHAFVYGELFIGDKGGRPRLLSAYERMDQAALVPHDEVTAFVRQRALHGRGLGWVDAHVLASALVSGARLWTADAALAAVARELGAAFA